MSKKELHPKWYQTKVYCDGKLILEVGSTKEELSVDVWSGNHPFYTGSQRILDTEGRVEKFQRKYNFKQEDKINFKKEK
jgi:large subunit ribosomal protein L31